MNKSSIQNTGREIVPDILKCLGCISVIIIHTASQSMSDNYIYSFNWISAVFWGSLCRFAVPVFLMVTGALMLDTKRKLSFWRIYEHYFLRILLCLLFWSLMYELYFIAGYWILYRQFDSGAFISALKNVLFFDHHFHLYYLQILLVFYLFLPLLRWFAANADRKMQRYALLLWLIFGILMPTLFKFEPFKSMSGIPAEYPLKMTYSAMGYTLLGWYLKNTEIKRSDVKKWLGLFAAGFAIVFGVTVAVSMIKGSFYQEFLDGFSPGVALMAAGIFGLVTALYKDKDAGSMPKVVKLSKASFCIFLVHHFFVMLLRTYLYTAYKTLPIIVIPAQALVVFVLSVLTYALLSRIPWVKDHLI